MTILKVSLCILLFTLSVSSLSFAQEGLTSVDVDDSFTALSAYPVGIGAGSVDLQLSKIISPDYWSLRMSISYGLFRTGELILNIPYAFDYAEEEGFQDINFALKQVLFYEGRYNPSISIIGTYSVDGKRNISTGGAVGGGVLITKKVGPFVGNLNLLYFHPHVDGLDDEYQIRIGGNVSVSHDFVTILDFLIKKSFYSNEIDHIEGRFGYSITLSSSVSGYGGFGYDFKEDIESWSVFFRLNIRYGLSSHER